MIRYADPGLCPDCRAPINGSMVTCDACGLSLRGLLAQRLFTTLQQADALLSTLRSEPGRSPETAPAAPVARPPARPGRPRRPESLSASSVPTILLSLGAGCLLIAALVFLAVTWSALGVGGRTAVLVVLTVVAAVLAGWLGRRRLRGACEALALVAFGLLSLDLAGASSAGWFGELSTRGFLVLLGTVLLLTGAGAGLAARRTAGPTPEEGRPGRLVGGELVAAIGTALVVLAAPVDLIFGDSASVSAGLVCYVLLAAAITAIAHRLGLPFTAAGTALITALAWAALAVVGLVQVGEKEGSWHDLWVGFAVWPVLVAAALVAGVGLIRRLRLPLRVAAVAVGHLLLVVAVLAPTRYLDQTQVALVALAVLLLTAVLTALLTRATPFPWGLANGLTQLVAGLGVLVVVVLLVSRAGARLGAAADFSWGGGAADALAATGPFAGDGSAADLGGDLAAWLLPLGLLGLAVAALSLRSITTTLGQQRSRLQVNLDGTTDLAAGAAAAGAILTVALYDVPVWTVLALALLVTTGFVLRWARTGRPAALPAGILSAAVALALASHAIWLFAPTLLVLTCAALLVHLRTADGELATAAGIVTSLGLGVQVWVWGDLGGLAANWRAVLAAVVLGLVVLGAGFLPDRTWRARPDLARAGLELGAATAYVPVAACAVLLAPVDSQPGWTAVHLTLAGAVVTALGLLRPDRRVAGWVGGALLAAASWVRLWDVGVREPEPYTLPTATVLLLLGLLRLRRDRRSDTLTALGPGLMLALLPSLLWALDDPVGLRALLLGLAALALVLVGVSLRWAAPVLLAGAAGALLVLRLAGPFVGAAVPRWLLIGLAGALLLVVGATWERRLQEARAVTAYVRGLR